VKELHADEIRRVTEVTYLGVVYGRSRRSSGCCRATAASSCRSDLRSHTAAFRCGYDSQQTDRPRDPRQPDNPWAPVAGDRGAHGRFDARAIRSSPQTWANEHSAALLGLAVGGEALLWITGRR